MVRTGLRPLPNPPNARRLSVDQAKIFVLQLDFGHCPIKTQHSIHMAFGFCLSQAEKGEYFRTVTMFETT
jgi:hypothetical protein